MRYRCTKNDIRSRTVADDILVEIPYVIKNMCDVRGYGVYFIAGAAVGIIKTNGHVIYPVLGHPEKNASVNGTGRNVRFNYPSDICYSERAKRCFITESQGREIRTFDPFDHCVSSIFQGGSNQEYMDKLFGKLEPSDADAPICADSGYGIYWASSVIHRCWKYSHSTLGPLMGTGRPGYSICSNPQRSMIAFPRGIAINRDKIYISDNGNRCVRAVDQQGVSLLMGHPQSMAESTSQEKTVITPINYLYNPTTLVCNKSLVYVKDGTSIKHCHASFGVNARVISRADNVETICANSDGGLICMVNEDAEETRTDKKFAS